ncbi:hypothetical protein L195_g019497 [Trifolium pratense]|uniref:Uncharacterized protein n=1 Tax=Trifolium pratense TaxID=57577 RepID=A0A2K3MZU4_TRIPR|nr:hypothetical protein L195_g019497 [Trifolium pratense]
MSSEMENSSSTAKRKLSCTACFDALWFCYSPVHQMQQYYRLGTLDNCSGKWKAMVDCLMLKTKPRSQVESMALKSTNDAFNSTSFIHMVNQAHSCVAGELIWLKHLLTCFEITISSAVLFCDNPSIIHLVSSPTFHERSKSQHRLAESLTEPLLAAEFLLLASYHEVLEAREKAKPHIWNFRTRYEASQNWQRLYGHLDRPE